MQPKHVSKFAVLWLIGGLALAACSRSNQGIGATSVPSTSSAADVSTLPTAVAPTATQAPPATPLKLTILHTNDNWGATEPCG